MKQFLVVISILIFTGVQSQVQAPVAPKLKIEMTVEEAETIVAALQKEPYAKVATLINSIVSQANSQLRPDTTQGKVKPHKN